jgi:hypothetical protein
MAAEELTQEEVNRLYSISVIPAVVIFAIVAFYYGFVHLERIYPPDSLMLDLFINMFLPIIIAAPAAFFLTFETICSRRKRSPPKFHVKRFLGRMTNILLSTLSFFAIYVASYFFLAPVISEKLAMLCSFWIWLLTFGILIMKFRHFFSRLNNGEW